MGEVEVGRLGHLHSKECRWLERTQWVFPLPKASVVAFSFPARAKGGVLQDTHREPADSCTQELRTLISLAPVSEKWGKMPGEREKGRHRQMWGSRGMGRPRVDPTEVAGPG